MWLVYWSHPGTESFIEEDIFRIESFKLWILCCSNFLRHKVISTKIECETNDTNRTCPKSHDRNEKHKEVKPTLIAESNTKNLRPETVSSDHGISFLFLSRIKCFKSVCLITVFIQGILYCNTMNGRKQCTT